MKENNKKVEELQRNFSFDRWMWNGKIMMGIGYKLLN